MSLSTTSSGALYLILIQITSRALTFAGNQLLLRVLTPEHLGLAVQLELFSISILYFSRESIRVALQRQPQGPDSDHGDRIKSERSQSQIIVNLSYVAVFLGLILTTILGGWYQSSASHEVLRSPRFTAALRLYAVATAIELLSEPMFVIIQQQQMFKQRAKCETSAAVAKCLSACMTAFVAHRFANEASVLPFAIGQLVYAITILVSYTRTVLPYSATVKFSLLPRFLSLPPAVRQLYALDLFSRPLLTLSTTLYAQSIFKQLLTHGDTLVLSVVAPLSDQGSFALASNYGSLFARLLFQPIEESSRNYFGATLSSGSSPSSSKAATAASPFAPSDPAWRKVIVYLSTTLHFYGLLAIVCASLLPTLLPFVVTQVFLRNNPTWSNPQMSSLLSTYCYLIPLLAYNGILDAFLTSVATPSQLRTQSLVAIGCTGTYALAVYVCLGFLGMGAKGLVLANIIGMTVRIGWCAWWIVTWVRERQNGSRTSDNSEPSWWPAAMPNWGSIAVGVITTLSLRADVIQYVSKERSYIAGFDVWEIGRLIGAGMFLGSAM